MIIIMTIVDSIETILTSISSISLSLSKLAPILSTHLNQLPSLPSLQTTSSFITNAFWRYLPFLPFIVILWPFVISFFFTLTSASTWLFWLFTSLVFGIIQLIFVLYQFIMISFDLGVLSLLKTYSTMRNLVRYYTLRSGIHKGSRRDREYVSKRGRKREWRKKLNNARSLKDFESIEIQEPPPLPESGTTIDHSNSVHSTNGRMQHLQSPQKKISLRRVQSFHSPSLSSKHFNKTNGDNHNNYSNSGIRNKPPIHRSQSDHLQTCDNFPSHASSDDDTSDFNQITHELGMNGTMLLQTTFRLRETRLQASSTCHKRQQQEYVLNLSQISSDSSSNNSSCILESDDNDDDCKGDNVETIMRMIPKQNDDNNTFPQDNENTISLTINSLLNSEKQQDQQQSQENNAASELKFLLRGVVKRNHLSINDLLKQDALSVMDCGRHSLSEQSRNVILNYHEEVEKCLEWIANFDLERTASSTDISDLNGNSSKFQLSSSLSRLHKQQQQQLDSSSLSTNDLLSASNPNNKSQDIDPDIKLYKEISDRLNLIRKLKHNMGRTALMLSGGGAQAMYHLGTIKALCESKLYDDIEVISGTSGGSITAAMCAIKTREELLNDVCLPTVSTDYGLNGEMKKNKIRWFPTNKQMCEYWLKHKLLVDSKEFKRCCDFYFGDITFEEAFEKTGKHICITVSASRSESNGNGDGGQRLLLNHISTPHVTLASAVAASCALPGVMAPAKLVTKNSDSKQELFEVDGVEWIDGSVQADLPFKRISTLFNVSNYIVCQTNFHVLPFLHKAHHPDMKSFYWRAFQTCEWDIRNRALNLSRLGLFPKIFGQDISKVFKQKYHGDLTLVPRFTTMQVFGLKALVNPTYEDMEVYLQNGQSSAWPYLSVIREMLRLERAIDKCIKSLNERLNKISPENDWDDVESIASVTTSQYKKLGARRENELLKQRVHALELENLEMRKQLDYLQRTGGIKLVKSRMTKHSSADNIKSIQSQEKYPVKNNHINRFWKKGSA